MIKKKNKGPSKALFSKLDSNDPKDKNIFGGASKSSNPFGKFGSKEGTEGKKAPVFGTSTTGKDKNTIRSNII